MKFTAGDKLFAYADNKYSWSYNDIEFPELYYLEIDKLNSGSFDLYAASGSALSSGGSGGGGVPENGSITKEMLSEDLASEFTKPIAIDRLPQSVRDDLSRTITKEMLSQEVLSDLNRTIGLSDCPPKLSKK